ncbi:hypothetical protein [Zunongwangia sp.]|uniref:hypothetical protein n=1 Tax=Zunongwangia sp. TaxID=1965325 RepID=UPI003AA7E2DE
MSHLKTNLPFFRYQRKLVLLWLIWGSIIFIFTFQKSFFGYFKQCTGPIWTFIGVYVGGIYSLITCSSFFKHKLSNYLLEDIIYFRLAYISSIIYLLGVSIVIFIIPLYILQDGGNLKDFRNALVKADTIFKVLLPIQIGLLTYFFFKKEKVE